MNPSVYLFVCAACVLVMGLHAVSALLAWLLHWCHAFLWHFGVGNQRKNRSRAAGVAVQRIVLRAETYH